ncbi:probable serine/threonine-protein kinase PBL2 isoform X2 [Primulina eburnea]
MTNPTNRSARSMAFKEIKKATGNFQWDLRLGEGAFGIVYKGWIREDTLTAANGFMRALSRSRIAVAVKKWKPFNDVSFLGPETWSTELKYLCQLNHPNVVKLIGYCSEGGNFVLVYELLPKGSLRNHLLRRGHQALSWDTRIEVAIGAARGLSFLHDREIPVIHRDFHADNILLDADFNAKLSGFGLAKDGPTGDASHVSTRVMGTWGFVAPEYVATGHLTAKCDVFAFGVVLLQILSGRANVDIQTSKLLMNGNKKLSQIVDPKLNGQYPRNAALAVMRLAFQCLNSDPKHRPRMDEVLVSLQKLQAPKNDG